MTKAEARQKGSDSSARLRVALAEDERDIREYLEEALRRQGHEVVVSAGSGKEVLALAREARPDLLLTDIKMPDLDGIDLAAELNRERAVPVILVSGHHDADLVRRAAADHILAYLIKPISEADLAAAVPLAMLRFRHFRALAEEAVGLRQALEDRKVIEKAKGILMRRLRLDEDDAFRRLRMHASNHNSKLVEVARQVASADEIFHQLEGIHPRN